MRPSAAPTSFPRRLAGALGALALGTLAACGGGGGGGGDVGSTPPVSQPPAPTTGTVALLFTDAPTHDFCQILATVESVDLLSGNGGRTTVFTGPETIDVLAMRNYTDVFSVAAEVPAGSYEKIRLTLSDLALVECDAEGNPEPESGWDHPKLPGNGKLDLNPRGSFQVVGGETMLIEIDLDMEKSLHLVKAGNSGRWQFRPVVFVTIRPDDTKLVRVFGEARDLDGTHFELCPVEPASSMDDDEDSDANDGDMSDDDDSGRCLDVHTDGKTGIFDETGAPAGLSALANGDLLTAVGFLRAHDDDDDGDSRMDDLRLDAVVLEFGASGTFERIVGAVRTAPGSNDIFEFLADAATTPIDVLLQSGTRYFAIGSNEEIDPGAIQPGTAGEVDGVFTNPATDPKTEPLRAALIVLEQGASAPAVSLLDRKIDATTPSDPVTTPPSGKITLEPTVPAAAYDCVKTTADTRILKITETASSSETAEVEFGTLVVDDVIDVYGSADPSDATCVIADTVQKYAAPAP